MLFWIVIVLTFCSVAADLHHFRRLRRENASPQRRRIFVVWAAATDALPLIVASGGWLLHDNTTTYMLWSMWLFWIWIVAVASRACFFIFNMLRLPWIGLAASLCIAVAMLWGATAGRTTLHVDRIEVCSPRLPAAFDGLHVVQISDLHVGTLVRPVQELHRLVDRIDELHPDLIIFTGDLVNIRSGELTPDILRELQRIAAPVYSVTGNHDAGNYIKDTARQSAAASLAQVIERQAEIGWRVLQDTTVYLRRGNDSISLSGISFDPALHWQRHAADLHSESVGRTYAGVPDSLFNITAVHLPQLWQQIVDSGRGDLTLAGHVHGMQLKIRLFGHSFSPASWLYEHWSGPYAQQGRILYINDGIGCVGYPMRLGAWPEITSITLRTCP